MLEAAPAPAAAPAHEPFEGFERRFGGLRRLYGSVGAQRIFDAHAVVVGIGGVGSWAAEALARSGVGRLTLIDLDHLAESNINRQLHALSDTLGQSKVLAMQQRIAQINPAAQVHALDRSGYVAPALYWQGNAQYAARQHPAAIETFRRMIAASPRHPRVPDALLGIANAHIELRDNRAARAALQELIQAHPNTEAASVARERLTRLR